MTRRLCLVTVAVATIASAQTSTQSSSTGPSSTRQHVQTLASDKLDGRLTGSAGERLAGDYIVSQLEKIGAKPVPGQTDYRVPFEFTAGSKDGGSQINLSYAPSAGVEGGVAATARALSFSDNGDVSGPGVFAGYGLVVPDSQDFGYDSYAGLDVKDKIVLILRYFPEDAEPKTKGILARYPIRYAHLVKTFFVCPIFSFSAAILTPLSPMPVLTARLGSGKGAVRRHPGQDAEEAQKALDSGNPHVAGFELPGYGARQGGGRARETD